MGRDNIAEYKQFWINVKSKPTRIIDKNTTILTTPDLVASNFGVASSSRKKHKQRSNLKHFTISQGQTLKTPLQKRPIDLTA